MERGQSREVKWFGWYAPEENSWAQQAGCQQSPGGEWRLPDGRIYVPWGQASNLVTVPRPHPHGQDFIENLLRRYLYFPNLAKLCASASAQCLTCARNNAAGHPGREPGVQHRGEQPLEDLQVEFTEVKPSRGYKYLLAMVCVFSGWVEAFPTKTEKSREVTRASSERSSLDMDCP